MPPWAKTSHLSAIYAFAERFGYSVDHLVPINSPWVCGLHCRDNLTFLPLLDNIKKSNCIWPDMWQVQLDLFKPETPNVGRTQLNLPLT